MPSELERNVIAQVGPKKWDPKTYLYIIVRKDQQQGRKDRGYSTVCPYPQHHAEPDLVVMSRPHTYTYVPQVTPPAERTGRFKALARRLTGRDRRVPIDDPAEE